MTQKMTCPRGHEWTADLLPGSSPQPLNCPHCAFLDRSSNAPVTDEYATVAAARSTVAEAESPPSTILPPPAPKVEATLMHPAESEVKIDSPLQTFPTLVGEAGASSAKTRPTGAPVKQKLSDVQVPGYELLEELGRGGMGVVYKARQTLANRLVALKMILAGGHASDDTLRRFRLEGEAVASLQHPNIVQVYEVGEHEGRPYFSLEYLEGGSLADYLDGTPWKAKDAAEIIETLALAMQHAHDKGIVHRDLKPANILLSGEWRVASGESKESSNIAAANSGVATRHVRAIPKITDFGLAKQMESKAGQTQSGDVLGTPSYMAPEQAAGRLSAIGPATDVYALGAILYELVTGRPPFKGTTLLDTLEQVRVQEPVSPRQLQLRAPRDLETICLKCLQKDPSRRYASTQALAEDLARFRAGTPILARPVSLVERLYRWARRNPRVAALSAALLLVTLTGLISVSVLWRRAEAQKQAAVDNLKEALSAVDLYLTKVGDETLLNEPGAEDLRRQLLLAAKEYYERFVAKNEDVPELKLDLAKSLYRLGQILGEVETPAAGIKQHERALALFQSLPEKEPQKSDHRFDLAQTHHHLGRLYRLASGTKKSQEHYDEAERIWVRLTDKHAEDLRYKEGLARTRMGLGNLAKEQGDLSKAETRYRESLMSWRGLVKDEPEKEGHRRDLAVNLDNLAGILDLMGQSAAATVQSAAGIKVLAELVKSQPRVAQYQNDLARAHFNSGKRLSLREESQPARQAYQGAIAIWQQLRRDYPLVPLYAANLAAALHNAGDVEKSAGKFDAADKLHGQALKLMEELIEKQPRVADYRFKLALARRAACDAQIRRKEADGALLDYQKVADELDKLVAEHPEVAEYRAELVDVRNQLGLLHREKKEVADAAASFQRGIEKSEQGKRAPALILAASLCRVNLADLQREDKKFDAALQGYAAASAALEELLKENYRVSVVQLALRNASWSQALIFDQQGDSQRAEMAWKRAMELSDAEQVKALRYDRAFWQVQRATAAQRAKETDKALALFLAVIQELDVLTRELYRPGDTFVTLRNAYMGQAQSLTQKGQHAAAAQAWNKMIETEEQVAKHSPPAKPEDSRKRLHYGHWMRARALTEATQYADAIRSWDRVLELTEEKQKGVFTLHRIETLARSGAHEQATKEADVLLAQMGGSEAIAVAGIHASAASVAQTDARIKEDERTRLADQYARRAIGLLLEAEMKGHFKTAANVSRVQTDKTFDSLRGREEYQALMKRLGP